MSSRRALTRIAVGVAVLALVAGPGATAIQTSLLDPFAGFIPCVKTGTYTAVWQVQGTGESSPMDGQTLADVRGIVTMDAQRGTGGPDEPRGFFLQAHESDCLDATSDGVFVFTGSRDKNVDVGDLVRLTNARVDEYQGPSSFTWDATLTELVCGSGCGVATLRDDFGVPDAVPYDPPVDETQAAAYNERLEGMLVTVDEAATVVAATNAFNEIAVVRGLDADRLHADSEGTGHRIVVDGDAVSGLECAEYGVPDARTFDTLRSDVVNGVGIHGPLTYNFNAYKVLQDDDVACLTVQTGDASSFDPVANPPPVADADTLTVATVNAYNFFDNSNDPHKGEPVASYNAYHLRAAKLAAAVCDAHALAQPLIVGLQEVENANALATLAAKIQTRCGASYDAHIADGPDNRGIDTAFLTRSDRITVTSVAPRQGCTDTDHFIAYEPDDDGPGIVCGGSTPYFLHSRPPLELRATVTLDGSVKDIVAYANHFKSKRSSSSCEDNECADWRLDEAAHINELVEAATAADPNALVIVLGDLNDGYSSDVHAALVAPDGPLTDPWDDATGPPGSGQGSIDRYSYVHDGAADTLDYVLVAGALAQAPRTLSARHLSVDWPASLSDDSSAYRVSDHDSILVAFHFG